MDESPECRRALAARQQRGGSVDVRALVRGSWYTGGKQSPGQVIDDVDVSESGGSDIKVGDIADDHVDAPLLQWPGPVRRARDRAH
jgi:hypothetical protein